jgi:hypothetical protein
MYQPFLIAPFDQYMLYCYKGGMFMSRLIELSGKVFGNLKVLFRDKEKKGGNAFWVCKCACGVNKSVRANHLLSGGTKSCGCLRERDLTGLKFNSWTVLKRIEKENPKDWNGNKYLCRCDCGNEKELLGGSVVSGASKTCGCWQIKDAKTTALQSLFTHSKNQAKRRKIDFCLTKELFAKLTESNCAYCGDFPSQQFNVKYSKILNEERIFLYSGIDRVESSKGYTKDNVVPCCRKCNVGKHSLSLFEWKVHLKKICTHLGIL